MPHAQRKGRAGTTGGTAGIQLARTRPAAPHVGLSFFFLSPSPSLSLSSSLTLSPPLSMRHHLSFIHFSSCSFSFPISHYLSHCLFPSQLFFFHFPSSPPPSFLFLSLSLSLFSGLCSSFQLSLGRQLVSGDSLKAGGFRQSERGGM